MPTEDEIAAAADVIDRWLWNEVSVRDAAIAALEAAEAVRKQSDLDRITTTRNPDACQRRLTSNGTTCDRCGQETSATTAVMPPCPYNAPAPTMSRTWATSPYDSNVVTSAAEAGPTLIGSWGMTHDPHLGWVMDEPAATKLEPLPPKDLDAMNEDELLAGLDRTVLADCQCLMCQASRRPLYPFYAPQLSEVAPTPTTQPRQDYHTSAIPGDGIETAGPLDPDDGWKHTRSQSG